MKSAKDIKEPSLKKAKIKKEKPNKYQDKYHEVVEQYRRALADYQNLAKQKDKEMSDFVKYANSSLLQDILPVYDNLKLSLIHADESSNWLEGVKYVVKQFKDILATKGIKEIVTIGQPFDHDTMEALEEVATDQANLDNQVAKELKPGYLLHDRVLSSAKVAVYKFNN